MPFIGEDEEVLITYTNTKKHFAGVAEPVDAPDSKSGPR